MKDEKNSKTHRDVSTVTHTKLFYFCFLGELYYMEFVCPASLPM